MYSQRMIAVRRWIAAAFGTVLITTSGCGTGSSATTNSGAGSSTATPAASLAAATNLVYVSGDDRLQGASEAMDVLAPNGSGNWPVVVIFHGDPGFAGKLSMLSTAAVIAGRGRVVFIPDWGHTAPAFAVDASQAAIFHLFAQEAACAVAFAEEHAAEFGGAPDNLTIYGYSAGGNAALMAGLAQPDPLDACAAAGAPSDPQAVVSADGDVLLGSSEWDESLAADHQAFYEFTPWRHLMPPRDIGLTIAATSDSTGPYDRQVGPDPATSFVADRHTDIDLVGELTQMGLLADGGFSLKDSNEWAYQTLVEAGYDTRWVLLPDSTHEHLSETAKALLVDAILNSEGS